ncbi:phage baseplate assembly protein V [Paenibacillus sp. 1-18]|uniref:phage baseplate assembly protein V n=1 Tax=Paenibacillus sp. 1-18 TaxID=1333846 RepID=UPI00046F272C|nr:phage baseplate assembly protein V [Paenibacillus sp. 1-18]
MDKVQETSGYRHVELLSKVPLQTMTDIRIERRLGDHVRLVVSGIVPEEKQERFMELESEAEPIEVIEKDKDGQRLRTLFHGQMTGITLKQVHGIHYVQLEAISHTIRLDVRPVTRSFQDHTMTYGQLLKQILAGYAGADVIDTVSGDARLGALILQYRETDWAFLKRMASRFGAVLVPEAAADAPKFWFGIPEGRPGTLDEVPYHSRKSFVGADGAFSDGDRLTYGASSVYEAEAILAGSLPGSRYGNDEINDIWSDSSSSSELSAVRVDGFMSRTLPGRADLWHRQPGNTIGVRDNEANSPYGTFYTVESARYFRPGDVVSFQGKELLVADIVSRMDRGLFLHTYTLVSEDEIRQKPIWNGSVRGASLEGRVLEVERDQVRVHLTIDAVQEREKACWFPYATGYSAEGHSGWYVMPEKGDMVQVQFPTLQESDGFAARSLRRSGKSVPELGNPDIKYWGTPHDKLVKLSAQELLVSAKTNSVYISLDAKGIQVHSDHALSIAAKRELTIHAEDTLDITANEAIYLQAGSSSVVIDGETDIRSSRVKLDGIIKRPVFVADLEPVPEPPLMSIKAYQAAHAPKSTGGAGGGSPSEQGSGSSKPGKAGVSHAASASPKANLLGGMLNVAQKALSIIGTIPVLGTPARMSNSKLTSIRRDVAKGGPTRALKYAAAGLSMLAGVPSGGWAVLGGRNLAREAAAFNRRVAAYKKNGVGQRYAAAYRGKVWTAARNVASSRSLGELAKSLAHNMDKLNTEYHKIPLEVRAGWKPKNTEQSPRQPWGKMSVQERKEPTEEDKKKWGIRGTYVYITVNEDYRPDIPEGSYWAADRVVRKANGDPDIKYYEDWKKSYPGDFLILSNKEGISQEEQRWMSLSNMTEGPFVFDGRGGGRGPSAEEFKQFFSQSSKKQITEDIISNSAPVKQQSKNILEQEVKLGTKGTDKIDDFAKEPFLPDEYYKKNYAPMQGTPGARIDFSRLGSSGQIEKSRVIYDQAGKQKYRIDYSDHGNFAHHTNPHMHEYVYQDAGKNVKSEIKYFMDFSTGRLRQGVIDEATNSIKFID